MDRSKALNSLAEAVELTKLLEEHMAQQNGERATATMPGMRITLRTIREMISNSHDVLARELVAAARMRMAADDNRSASLTAAPKTEAGSSAALAAASQLANAVRRDLRSTLEKGSE